MSVNLPGKVALLLSSLKFGGAERVTLTIAKALQDSGVIVEILLMSNEGEFVEEANLYFKVFDLKCNKTYKLPLKLFFYYINNKPNVIISSFWKLNLCTCISKLIYPFVKIILWEHSPPSKNKNNNKILYYTSASILYRLAKKVIVVSSGVYKDVASWTYSLENKLIIIYNAIPQPKFSTLPKAKSCNGKVIVWVGRLDKPKNPMLMLEAFNLISPDIDCKLLIVGDGVLMPELLSRCKELNLEGRVKFLGYQQNPYEYIVSSDLLVLSSDREGLGNVIIEAMHCGLRVVSTDCGEGIHDILLNNIYGSIVPCRDEYKMARAIEYELYNNYDFEFQKKGAERFLPQTIVQQFLLVMQ